MQDVFKVKSLLLKDLVQFVAFNGFVPDEQNYVPVMPDGKSALVLNLGKAYERVEPGGGEKRTVKGSHFVGIKSRCCYVRPNNEMKTISIRFKPGALPFILRTNVSELTDSVVEADQLFGREIFLLEEKIAEEDDQYVILKIIERFLLKRININNNAIGTLEKIRTIYNTPSHCRVEDLRNENISYKKLERDFIKNTGLAPKQFINIVRFNYSTSILYKDPSLSFVQAGYQAGYYDQAHFIKSFKKLSGFAPGKYMKQGSLMFLDNQQRMAEEF